MSRDESLDAEETPAGAEGAGLRKRLFDSYAGELSTATWRYMLGSIGPDQLIADGKKILPELETFCAAGGARFANFRLDSPEEGLYNGVKCPGQAQE